MSILFSPLVSYIRRSVNRSCFNLDKINLVVLLGITCLKQMVRCHSNTGTVLKLWSMYFDKTCKIYVLLGYHEREKKKERRERGVIKIFFLSFLESMIMWEMIKLLHALLCCYFLHFNDPHAVYVYPGCLSLHRNSFTIKRSWFCVGKITWLKGLGLSKCRESADPGAISPLSGCVRKANLRTT